MNLFLLLRTSLQEMTKTEEKYSPQESNPKIDKNVNHIIGLNETISAKKDKLNDQKLWLKLKIGCDEAFRELFLKYNDILSKYGMSIVKDSIIVEDCIHDLFLYLWSKRESLTEVESVKYYLIVSFRRRIFRVIQEKAKADKLLDGIKLEFPKHEDFFEKKFITDQNTLERENVLNKAVDELPPRQKQVLNLRYLEGLPYVEISIKMGISNVSVRKLSSKAIKNLRKKVL